MLDSKHISALPSIVLGSDARLLTIGRPLKQLTTGTLISPSIYLDDSLNKRMEGLSQFHQP